MDEVSATSGQIGSPPESGMVEPVTADREPGGDGQGEADGGGDTDGAAHVPVKRKGARKR
ncbi:hypothetical protein BH09ACT12_BH09ACT12_12250 [soil metagenome]